MKISPKLRKVFNILRKQGNKQEENDASCDQHLYTNFYLNISQKVEDFYESQSGDIRDKDIRQLTEENVKKIPKMKRSKSVEDWLKDLDDSREENWQATKLENIFLSDKRNVSRERRKCSEEETPVELHYACVDVTIPRPEPSNIHHSKLFASSSEIFRSYSSFLQSSSDSSLDFHH